MKSIKPGVAKPGRGVVMFLGDFFAECNDAQLNNKRMGLQVL